MSKHASWKMFISDCYSGAYANYRTIDQAFDTNASTNRGFTDCYSPSAPQLRTQPGMAALLPHKAGEKFCQL